MKHYFHFLFTGAVLLVSLMIFNGQKELCDTHATSNPDIEHIDLLAEICSTQIASTSVPSYWHNSGNLNHLEYLNTVEHQIRLKTQMQIHLELKPGLDFQSGQNLHPHSRYEDPTAA